MSTSTSRKDLFRVPAAADKLALFQYLFDASEINTELALALLKVIHHELCIEQTPNRMVYKNYAGAIQSLRFYQTDMLQRIIDAWNAGKTARDPEWIADGTLK